MRSDEVKAIRTSLGLNQQDFATRLNVSMRAVSRWETGKAKPSRLATEKLEKFQKIGQSKNIKEGY
jgi:putative transcriptional regulator